MRISDWSSDVCSSDLAIKNIIAAPQLYDITLPTVENQPYFVAVTRTHDIDVKLAAKLAELPLSEFKALNPQFNRPVIAGSSSTKILQTGRASGRERVWQSV